MENMPLAINLVFVGLTVVFIALILLSLIIYFSTKLLTFKKKDSGKNAAAHEASILEIDEEEAVVINPQVPEVLDSVKSDDELIAVIMAAIQASMLPESHCKIKVNSFRRIVQTSPAWNKAGRLEQITNRL